MAQFQPDKNYTWDSDVDLTIKGKDFEDVMNAIHMDLSTPEAQTIIRKYEIWRALVMRTMKTNVESGKMTEKPDDSSPA